jgi:hypothetical protein
LKAFFFLVVEETIKEILMVGKVLELGNFFYNYFNEIFQPIVTQPTNAPIKRVAISKR